MPRIRSVHPGLFTDESFIQLSDSAQVFWIGLWTEADDQGVFEWKPATLKLRLRGASTAPVEPLLAELVTLDCVRKFEVGGRQFGAIRNFQKFQRPKKPNQIHLLPSEFRPYVGSSTNGSEPNDAEGMCSSPPDFVEDGALPKKAENSPQMEDGGGRMEEEDGGTAKEPASVASLAPKREAQGRRLPDDWNPGDVGAQFARNLGLTPAAIFQQFRDYWRAQPGAKGRKADWPATWRNWCRREAERRPSSTSLPLDAPRMTGGL